MKAKKKKQQGLAYVTTACKWPHCKSHKGNSHLQTHVIINVDLVVGSMSYRCCNVQCLACGKYMLIPMPFEVTTGRVHEAT